jgi:acyl carrier protein
VPALAGELAASLAEILEMPAGTVELDKPFADLGLDSIFAVQWAKQIEQRYGVAVAAARMFDHPTVLTLAGHVAAEIAAAEPPPEPTDLSLEELLRRVQEQTLDLDTAELLLAQLNPNGSAS